MAEQLSLKKSLAESRSMAGALGAIAFGVLKGLEAGGADAKVVAGVRVLMQEHFSRLSDDDCNVLCDVVYTRLQQEQPQGGRWYGKAKSDSAP